LISRFVGYTLTLDRGRDAVIFLLLGGPLSCLVNATISVTCLWMAGAISAHDFWFNWLTWWVGNAIGAMVVTPVLLSLSVRHGEIWKLRRISVALPLCLLLFVIISFHIFVTNKEQQRIETEFKLKAELIASQIKEEWNAHLDALYSEVGFFAASGQVDRDKFRVFARYWLTRHRSIQALEWIPRVQHAERSGYEESARRDGYPEFKITERGQQGQLVERAPQSEYFPVYYVEPYKGNEKALGFDLSSDENRMSALNQAFMTGRPVGTSRITLVQEKAGQYGFLVFMPVYDRKTTNPGEQELREAIRGFALGVFRIGDAMRVVVGQAETQGIRIQLTDLTADQREQLLYDSIPATLGGDDSKTSNRNVTSVAPWLTTTLEIAERRWQLSFSPTADYLAEHRSLQAWSVLAGGLIFAACACAFVLVVTGRAARIEVLVRERTDALEMEIAERRQAEKALQNSEEKYRELVENANSIIMRMDNVGKVTFFNEFAQSFFGYSGEEILGKNVVGTIVPEFESTTARDLRLMIEDIVANPDRYANNENENMRSSGERVWIAWTNKPIRDEHGQIAEVLCIGNDVTERKRAEEEVMRAKEDWERTFDAVPDLIAILDRDYRIVRVNKAMADKLGVTPAECIALRCYQAVHGASEPPLFCPHRQLLEDGIEHTAEFHEERLCGDFLVSVSPLLGPVGELVGSVHICRDITERKRAENALRESEERFSTFFRASPIGTSITSLSDGQIVDINDAYLDLSGYTRVELVGQDTLRLEIWANPEDRLKWQKTLEEQGRIQGFETRFRKKSGEIRDVLVSAEVIGVAGQQYILSLVYDITERKRAEEQRKKLEEQLVQAQKMESVGRLAGGVAHDFNNMLGVIIGQAELALKICASNDKLQHNLEEILNAGLRSADLTRQLLGFARKQTAAPKILDLNDTISGMLKMLKRLTSEDIDLSWHPGLDLGKVKIDPSQVDQILANLVVNARDAIPGVGAITMKTENVVIDDSDRAETPEFIPGQYVLLTVSDTGDGMSKEIRENIFEPFFTTKEVGKGTGLGLSTVYGIVKQNDGFIYVASELRRGTTFKIYLPRFDAETAQVPSQEAAGNLPTGTETILLVEDDEPILDLSKMILEHLGYTVIAAPAPVQALRIAEEHKEDLHLLITDVVMPEMNGRELAEQLRVIRPNLKCLYVSGYTADVIAHRGILD
ncbi:MAG: PAS domain S-box protein, partial [Syntrophobacteraceae bacterium]